MRRLSILVVLFALTFTACGGTGLPPSNSVSVTVTADNNTIAAGSVANLSGAIQGYSGSMVGTWRVEESYNQSKNACGYDNGKTPATNANCNYGYLNYNFDANVPTTATYHAPAVPGTYHVTFTVILVGNANYADMYSKEGTIAIVVQ